MGMTEIIMSFVFIGLFINIMIYDYVANLVNARSLKSCPEFESTFLSLTQLTFEEEPSKLVSPTGCNPLSADCPVGGGFSSGGGEGGGGGSSGAGGGETNWYDFLVDPLEGVFDFLSGVWTSLSNIASTVARFTDNMVKLISSFLIIFSSKCPLIQPIQIVLYVVFAPFIIGVLYIIARFVKSLIPTVGGD